MLRAETPCDFGPCPYKAEYAYSCATYCSTGEPDDDWDDDWDDEPDVDECGFDPYEGCYTYDC